MLNVVTAPCVLKNAAGSAIVACEPSVTSLRRAIARTLPEMQAEHEELVQQRGERRDHFAAAAFAFAADTRRKNRIEMDRSAVALRRLDKAIAAVSRDIRAFAQEELGKEEQSCLKMI